MFNVSCLPAIYLYSTLGLLTLVEQCYRNKDDDDDDDKLSCKFNKFFDNLF